MGEVKANSREEQGVKFMLQQNTNLFQNIGQQHTRTA